MHRTVKHVVDRFDLQMMFAERMNVDAFHDDHIIALLVENRISDNVSNRLFVPFGEEQHRFGRSFRCFQQT